MTDAAILEAVKAIVEAVAGDGRRPASAGPETRLVDGYWLDSMELLEVVVACEQRFGIQFEEETDLAAGRFDTLGDLARLVAVRLRERQGA